MGYIPADVCSQQQVRHLLRRMLLPSCHHALLERQFL